MIDEEEEGGGGILISLIFTLGKAVIQWNLCNLDLVELLKTQRILLNFASASVSNGCEVSRFKNFFEIFSGLEFRAHVTFWWGWESFCFKDFVLSTTL